MAIELCERIVRQMCVCVWVSGGGGGAVSEPSRKGGQGSRQVKERFLLSLQAKYWHSSTSYETASHFSSVLDQQVRLLFDVSVCYSVKAKTARHSVKFVATDSSSMTTVNAKAKC